MKKTLYTVFLLLWAAGIPICQAQTSVRVSDPRLEIRGNQLHISYDILEGNPGEKFTVSLVVKDEEGNTIQASALQGDIGGEVTGGANKQVIWNYEADNVYLNAYITIQVRPGLFHLPFKLLSR